MPKIKRVAVVLSGCGHKDGSEITEAVSAILALSEAGVVHELFAPNVEVAVVDPMSPTLSPLAETRNALRESARIARGHIRPLEELAVDDFDALALPGGFGAATVLCTWATQGAGCAVLPQAERAVVEFYQAQKPILAICIAPALVARVLGSRGITLTIGQDPGREINKTGAHHENCAVTDFVSDREHRVITTPAYMYGDATPFEVYTGVRKAVKELVEMA